MAVAAYASLRSWAKSLARIEQLPEDGELKVNKQQIIDLQHKVQILIHFLEALPPNQTLNSQLEALADEAKTVVTEVEMITEAEFLDQFHGENVGLSKFTYSINAAIEDLEFFISAMKSALASDLQDKILMGVEKKAEDASDSVQGDSNSTITSSSRKETIVGLKEEKELVCEKLARNEKSLQVIMIAGMGGIGKTTLARHVFEDPKIRKLFDALMWCTVSQHYNQRGILRTLLKDEGNEENLDLGTKLYQKLHGRRYLIVLDDIWSVDPWEYVKKFIPEDDNKKSRVIITTREGEVVNSIRHHKPHISMKPLDDELSWELLRNQIFDGKEDCNEFERIGRKISKNCKGLPISLKTIGGLLSKSERKVGYWENVAEHVKQMAGDCKKILSLSYSYLPVHLKACFCYFKIYQEDTQIDVEDMLEKWIVEGFVKPIPDKPIEDAARGYMVDLVGRNLIRISEKNVFGDFKTCDIHDLLHELSQTESKKERFFYILRTFHYYGSLCGMSNSMSNLEKMVMSNAFSAEVSTTARRAFIYKTKVLDTELEPELHDFLPVPILHLWNLEIIHVKLHGSILSDHLIFPVEIWQMKQLRHLFTEGVILPKLTRENFIVLEQLQTLYTDGLTLEEEIVRRFPNLKRLKLSRKICEENPHTNIEDLVQLQSLELHGLSTFESKNILLPHLDKKLVDLKKLIMRCEEISEEQMTTIGSLPNLQVLELKTLAHQESPVAGEFPQLKVMVLEGDGIKFKGAAESSSFPKLKKLVLHNMRSVELSTILEDTSSLRSIHLFKCDKSVNELAQQVLEEQHDAAANDALEIYVDGERLILDTPDDEDDSTM